MHGPGFDDRVWCVERLTLRSWWFSLMPRLVWRRLAGQGVQRCCVLESSRLTRAVAVTSGRLVGVAVEPVQARLLDLRDEEGRWMRLRIAYRDLADVLEEVMAEPVFREAFTTQPPNSRFPTYLRRVLTSTGLSGRGTLWRALLTVRVCAWALSSRHRVGQQPVVFMERYPGLRGISRYALRLGLRVVPLPASVDVVGWLRGRINPDLRRLIASLRRRWQLRRRLWRGARQVVMKGGRRPRGEAARPRVAVEYYGHLNLERPECYSDLFFLQQAPLADGDLLMFFNLTRDPLGQEPWNELRRRGIGAVALHPRATTVAEVPVFVPRLRRDRTNGGLPLRLPACRVPEATWLRARLATYRAIRDDWAELLAACNVNVLLTWFKYSEAHCAIAEAMEHVGGVTAIYQRSYEGDSSPETTINADIVFSFSRDTAELERHAHSVIPYHVTVGYPGDHRFPLLRESAARLRQTLMAHGVQRIIAYADENSLADSRWLLDHRSQQENYGFLLEKLLAESWLGLVLKPKSPATLRQRLGPVADLLRRAEATGRCYVFEEGWLQGSFPPSAAGLAADVGIHGHLFAGTAGMEMALAGVPTLLLDREGWSVSPLYRLGVGRVVFTDWTALWKACLDHWRRPEGVSGFGDWSPLRDELDPFHDGRAAERIGTYVRWLLDGFKAHRPRAMVMAEAAERYATRWGTDKVQSVNARVNDVANAREAKLLLSLQNAESMAGE